LGFGVWDLGVFSFVLRGGLLNNLKNRPLDYWLLWLIALLSVAINIWLLGVLLGIRHRMGDMAALAAQGLDDMSNTSLDYSVPVRQVVPIVMVAPISTTVRVPISMTLPIDMDVSVPVKTILGTIPFTVPIHTTVPVNIQPEVPLRMSVPISTTVPLSIEVPIQISLADTALGESLIKAQRSLEKLAAELR
jgi:hypothetical protein